MARSASLLKNYYYIMPHVFTSSHLTKGNTIFPNTIMIDGSHLYYSKDFVIGRNRIAIPLASIASVGLVNKILFSDLVVETRGGRVLYFNGFTHSDARRMYNLLRNVGRINR